MLFYNLSIDETLRKLGSRHKGLTAGKVKIPEKTRRKYHRIVQSQKT